MALKHTMIGLTLFVSLCCAAQQNYLELHQIVTDSARVFTSQEIEDLKSKLTNFESETSHQLVVLTIEELGNQTIEEYAFGTFNQNKLGQKDKDNGILIVFAKNDRQVRIEVGYGLEPYITDGVASRIIRNTMIPEFKEEDYFTGIDLATTQIITFLNEPEALEEFKQEIASEGDMNGWVKLFMGLFLSIFVAAGGFLFYKSYSGIVEMFRGMMIGKLGLLQGVFMVFFGILPMLFALVFVGMPLFFATMIFDMGIHWDNYETMLDDFSWIYWVIGGFFLFTMTLAIVKILIKGKDGFKLSLYKNDSTYMRKTFSSSGSHSFGSSSGSSSGGSSSFSGGGGSSGGGGASGSW
ncbi:TPM domain-containing protein [Flagellimonas algicola]|uniref:TPM domain-containing protein n=1 Tax=Flagellimonas algicola TaxID=2583815 RepID=A0ABY2WKU7_9FLAO|nr:TPM domain-containing protein [Allomuricauda algicola]TMU55463.1 TPM domain-containing protein [Allomuricauda algicola]